MGNKIRSFKRLREYLKSIPAINSGGCGIAAYFIYEFLKKEGKRPYIVMNHRYDEESTAKTNLKVLREGKGKPVAPAHVMVKCEGKYYDCNGASNAPWYSGEIIVPPGFLVQAIKNKNTWNNWFDRDHWLPKIEEKTGINLPMS